MTLADSLLQHRTRILEGWRELTLAAYPGGGDDFFAREKDPFKNPVGAAVRTQTEVILDGLLGAAAEDQVRDALETLVQMRAVQGFSPAQAVGFVFLLKRSLREALRDEALGVGELQELLQLESLIDNLALSAFDMYARRRDKIADIRAREARARVHSLLRRAGIVVELDSEDQDPRSSGAKGG